MPPDRPRVALTAPTLGRGRPPANPPKLEVQRLTPARTVHGGVRRGGSYTPLARRLNEHDRLLAYCNPLAVRDGWGPTPRPRSCHGLSNDTLAGLSRSSGIALRTRTGRHCVPCFAHASRERRRGRDDASRSLLPQGTPSVAWPRTQRDAREVISPSSAGPARPFIASTHSHGKLEIHFIRSLAHCHDDKR